MARFPVVRVERYKIVELKTYFKFIPRTIKRDLKVKKRARLSGMYGMWYDLEENVLCVI